MSVKETGDQSLQEIELAEGINTNNVPTDNEKRQERFLHDLELTKVANNANEEQKGKTSSLKRFFRAKPRLTSYSAGHNRSDDDEAGNAEAGVSGVEKPMRKRLSLRKQINDPIESDSTLDLSDNAKGNLKSSLSHYWNAVFKKKKSKSESTMSGQEEMVDLSASGAYSESALRNPKRGNDLGDDIHALKISDEPQGK